MKLPAHRRRSSGRRRMAVFVLAVAALAVLWGYGLFRFAALIPDEVADPTTPTDAIVVLTGGSGRVDEGLRLLSEKLSGRLFVSGVYPGADLSPSVPDTLSCCVEFGYEAGDTRGNAVETATWALAHHVRSLRVVTSVYHLPRSLLEFRHAMPGVVLVPHPVFADHVKREEWWLWPGTARLIVGEYVKYLLAFARQGGEILLNPFAAMAGGHGS